jgi:hypothetical protein
LSVFTAKGNAVHALKVCQVIRLTLRQIIGCLFAWDAGPGCSDFWRPGETGAVPWSVAGLPAGRQAGVRPAACPDRPEAGLILGALGGRKFRQGPQRGKAATKLNWPQENAKIAKKKQHNLFSLSSLQCNPSDSFISEKILPRMARMTRIYSEQKGTKETKEEFFFVVFVCSVPIPFRGRRGWGILNP